MFLFLTLNRYMPAWICYKCQFFNAVYPVRYLVSLFSAALEVCFKNCDLRVYLKLKISMTFRFNKNYVVHTKKEFSKNICYMVDILIVLPNIS